MGSPLSKSMKDRKSRKKCRHKLVVSPEIQKQVAQEREKFRQALATASRLAHRRFPYQYNKIHDAVDDVFGEGYSEAFRRFDPERGASFETLLHTIYDRMLYDLKKVCPARKQRQKRFSVSVTSFFRKQVGDHDFEDSQHDRIYEFDLSRPGTQLPCQFIPCRLQPCGHGICKKNLDKPLSLTPSKDGLETEHDFPAPEAVSLREYIDFLKAVTRISDDELHRVQHRYLPPICRRLRGAVLRKTLAKLDLQIVIQLIGTAQDRGYFVPIPKVHTQKQLEITRYFYESRIQAILERLEIPWQTMAARKNKRAKLSESDDTD